MQRLSGAEFEPDQKQRFEELWGQPPETYFDAPRFELAPDAKDDQPSLP